MKTVILAGGFGTRLSEYTASIPKPMVEVGGKPMLWHIMNIYAKYGFKEFVIALGYKADVIKDYFYRFNTIRNDLTVDLATGNIDLHDSQALEDWKVHLIDTGLNTMTSGRIKRLMPFIGNETFMMTYGDGVANVNIEKLVEFHRSHGKLATVTAVRPPSRFGGLGITDDGLVSHFVEKPQIGEGWINGGFFVLEPGVEEFLSGDEIAFERDPMEKLVEAGELVAYRHEDYWQCMDTLRDVQHCDQLWRSGEAPWKVW